MYDWLAAQPIKSIDLDQLKIDLSQLSEPHAEAIQVLIIHYNMSHGGQEAIPYNAMMLTKDSGVRYPDIGQLPIGLQRIIAAYIEHARKLSSS